MCTLTFLPKSNGECIITSNRDESSTRTTIPPQVQQVHGHKVLFPKDGRAGGSWVIAGDNRRVVSVLNGAFEQHEWNPPYRRSRGLLALDTFQHNRAITFFKQYNFEGVEPFTMVIFDDGELFEVRWDGTRIHHIAFDPAEPHIWASAQLYPQKVINKRQQWFKHWLQEHSAYHPKDILSFHKFAGDGDSDNDLVMNRGMVQTVSITCVTISPSDVQMFYEDLVDSSSHQTNLHFS